MIKKGLSWLKRNMIDNRCVVISDRQRAPYPEVTGYWIPTLLKVGEIELAENFARFLVSIQNPDGSFSLHNTDEKFVFDTGQIIRGWAAIAARLPEVREPMRKACEWIIAGADPATGKFKTPPPGGAWKLGPRGEVPEAVHMFVIQPMRDAAAILDAPKIRQAADRALSAYIATLDLTHFDRPNALTHLYAYVQEALVETGNRELAVQGMQSVAAYQQSNGAVPGYFDVPWVCSTGLAQLARVWYLLGEKARGDAALAFLSQLQNYSGGFYGSYGPGADYFPADELSWAVKFAIDSELQSVESHFDATANIYIPFISADDGRAKAVLSACAGAKRILDAGCGKGRYAALVKQSFPDAEVHGIDVSDQMLASTPPGIIAKKASIQNIPYENGSFDVVYCIETLEHAPSPGAAIAEMGRAVKRGGKLVIIDKNAEKAGSVKTEKWERWFGNNELSTLMEENGFTCEVSSLSYLGVPADDLFLCWSGTKKEKARAAALGKILDSNLPPEEWHESITRGASPQSVAANVLKGVAPPWIEPVLAESSEGETLLELGSGTGELSAHLARLGRNASLLDFSEDCLKFAADVFGQLGLRGKYVQGDVLKKLPFENQSVDVVWSSGLLEHFTDAQIAHIIAESARVAKKKVISLVPNANSKPYRLGKEMQEREGRWIWGKEDPKDTLKPVFEKAGLRNIREYSIAPEHALNFLDAPTLAPIRDQMARLFASLSPDQLQALNQGYLLVTIGEVAA